MSLNPQALGLNDTIRLANTHVYDLLSRRGKNTYFPKRGILAQSAEAKGKTINATIGTAFEDSGGPMALESLDTLLNLRGRDCFSYAPSPGRPEIRAQWRKMILQKNPSLAAQDFSVPVVTCALTHGLSMAGHLFVDEGDKIISPDLFWENYELVFNVAYGGELVTFPTFVNNARFNIDGLRNELQEGTVGKKIVLLNFPNNPTGYTVTTEEAEQIRDVLVESTDAGNKLLVLIDDAYFGLVFENGILKESIFSLLANVHERILAVKFDGPTKEDYVWGFRVGFVTFGIRNGTPELYGALESKLGGAIRGNISNASNVAQSLLLAAYASPSYDREKQEKFEVLKNRYQKIRAILDARKEYRNYFYALPFNSGYFMCIKLVQGDPEDVRRILLDKYSSAVIALGDIIRIAFSSTPFDKLEQLFENVYRAAREAAGD